MMRGWISTARLLKLSHVTPNKVNGDLMRDTLRRANVEEHGDPSSKRNWFRKTAALEHLPEALVAIKAVHKSPDRVGVPQTPKQAQARKRAHKRVERRVLNGAAPSNHSDPVRISLRVGRARWLVTVKEAREVFDQLRGLFPQG